MSLVDYASDEGEEDEETVPRDAADVAVAGSSASASDAVMMEMEDKEQVSYQESNPRAGQAARIQLPDVNDLLGPSASATTSNGQRKREPAANGSGHPLPNRKVPRGNLLPSRVPPDTAGGLLTPPQLRGRSNVATEDLDKIFTRRQQRR